MSWRATVAAAAAAALPCVCLVDEEPIGTGTFDASFVQIGCEQRGYDEARWWTGEGARWRAAQAEGLAQESGNIQRLGSEVAGLQESQQFIEDAPSVLRLCDGPGQRASQAARIHAVTG